MASPVPATRQRKIRSPWGVWWLCLVTLSIYYLVWYVKVNKDIASLSDGRIHVGSGGLWFSQCVPIANWISLANTSSRLTQVQAANGLPVTTGAGMMIISSWWFWSNTRYLQRRLNDTLRALDGAKVNS